MLYELANYIPLLLLAEMLTFKTGNSNGACEQRNQPSCSTTGEKFDQLTVYDLLKKDCSSLS
jgi:hypothetical protein